MLSLLETEAPELSMDINEDGPDVVVDTFEAEEDPGTPDATDADVEEDDDDDDDDDDEPGICAFPEVITGDCAEGIAEDDDAPILSVCMLCVDTGDCTEDVDVVVTVNDDVDDDDDVEEEVEVEEEEEEEEVVEEAVELAGRRLGGVMNEKLPPVSAVPASLGSRDA